MRENIIVFSVALLFLLGMFFILPSFVNALVCNTYSVLGSPCSDPVGDGEPCGAFAGEECSGGTCYQDSGDTTCSADSTVCSGIDACNDFVTTYSCNGAPSGGCSPNYSWPVNDSCTGLCPPGQTCSSGSCVAPACVATQGNACNVNACGTAGGTVNCDGTCSGSIPATPYTVGAACNRNVCGGTGTITDACTGACSASAPTVYTVGAACNRNVCGGTGTITDQCTGACSASAPTIYTVGAACTSTPNACNATNGTISDQCTGACTPPANPDSCARCNNLAQCNSGYQCSGPGTCNVLAPTDATLSFSASPSGNQPNTTSVTYTATSSIAMTGTPYYLRIYEGGTLRCSEPTGSSCTYSTSDSNTTRTFTAKIENTGGTQAVSPQNLSTGWYLVPSSVTLSANPSGNQANGTSVIYTATSNASVNAPSPYYIRIYEGGTQRASCSSGTTCTYSASGTGETRTFTAKVERSDGTDVVATSSSVSTTWVAADAIAPTVSVSGAPGSWQNTNATADITCSDVSGCESSGNWKWLTRNTSITDCSSFALGDYTGTYSGAFAITNHVWMCATARDASPGANRGYSSPVEFKVDKTIPDTPAINSPAASSWQKAAFTADVASDGDSGGSGLSACYYHVWDAGVGDWTTTWQTRTSCPNGDAVPSVGSGLNCRTQGSNQCTVYAFGSDAAGNNGAMAQRSFSIDYTVPSVGTISPTSAITGTAVILSATVSDATSGLSSCNLVVDGVDKGAMTVSGGTASKSYTFASAGSYQVHATCTDAAGNTASGSDVSVTAGDPTPTFPTGTWERLWYYMPGNPGTSFSTANYLGSNTISTLDRDWIMMQQMYDTSATAFDFETNSGINRIGFKASRTFTGLTPGPYTISLGADDGIKLFVDGSGNLLPANAWNNDHSWEDNKHEVRVTLGSTARIEVHYRENLSYAKVTFSYVAGFTGTTQEFECLWGISCAGPAGLWSGCTARVKSDGYCYYQGTGPAGCFQTPPISGCSAAGACTYQSRCVVQPGQTCTNLGCVEGTPPEVTINTASGQWYNGNSLLDVDATDNVALQSIKYQIDSYTADQNGTVATSDGSSSLAVSGTSMTANWRISSADWSSLSEGTHTIYVKAIDTSSNCRGCDGTRSFTIKKDTVAPTSKIMEVDDLDRRPGVRLNYPVSGASSAYLNADNGGNTKKTWWMYVVDADTGSGLNTCSISINGIVKPDRSCAAGWLTFTVGKPVTEADCTDDNGDNTCTIKVWARDSAGNVTPARNVNTVTNREKDYLDGVVTQDANEFSFSVDWKKPSAQ